jgi:hypothetical protein
MLQVLEQEVHEGEAQRQVLVVTRQDRFQT